MNQISPFPPGHWWLTPLTLTLGVGAGTKAGGSLSLRPFWSTEDNHDYTEKCLKNQTKPSQAKQTSKQTKNFLPQVKKIKSKTKCVFTRKDEKEKKRKKIIIIKIYFFMVPSG